MKEFKYVPKADSGFKGSVVVSVPKYKKRMSLLRECNFKMSKGGELETGLEQFDSLDKLISITEDHVVSVSLTYDNVDETSLIESIEDLGYYQEGVELINELGNLILSGFSLGKK